MSPRGESATPGRLQNTPGGGVKAHTRTPLATRTIMSNVAPPSGRTNMPASFLAFKPLFAGATSNVENNQVMPSKVCPATPPPAPSKYTSSATSPSSMIKSPNASNYACLYERYEGAPCYYPPTSDRVHPPPAPLNFGPAAVSPQHHQQAHRYEGHHRQNYDAAPPEAPSSILLKESKYDVGNRHNNNVATAAATNTNPYLVEMDGVQNESEYYSTGQSTTFSSRASSASTRCDWSNKQPQQRKHGLEATLRTPHNNHNALQPHQHGSGGGASWGALGDASHSNNIISQKKQAPPQYPTSSLHTTPASAAPSVSEARRIHKSSSSTYGLGGVGLPAGLLQTLAGGGDNNNFCYNTTATKLNNSNPLRKVKNIDATVTDSSAAPVEPFVSRPLWSLVGTFKTSLQTALDARKGNALRWTQSNPNGGRQRITIPFVNIASSEQVRLQVEDLQSHLAEQYPVGGRRSRSASVESNTSRVSSTTARRDGRSNAVVTGVKRSRSESAAIARQDRLLAKLPHFANKSGFSNNSDNSSYTNQPTTQPHRAAPRPVSMMSHAVVIKTKDMRPSQVTFGFNSSIEAALFNSKIRAIQRAAKDYVM